jgi:hypothetical protein
LLARWSRLKREQAARNEASPAAEAPAVEPPPAIADAGGASAEVADAVRVEDLPDIDSLTVRLHRVPGQGRAQGAAPPGFEEALAFEPGVGVSRWSERP